MGMFGFECCMPRGRSQKTAPDRYDSTKCSHTPFVETAGFHVTIGKVSSAQKVDRYTIQVYVLHIVNIILLEGGITYGNCYCHKDV